MDDLPPVIPLRNDEGDPARVSIGYTLPNAGGDVEPSYKNGALAKDFDVFVADWRSTRAFAQ